MIALLEVARRAVTGPKMADKEWNMGLFRKMQELEKRYRLEKIQETPTTPLTTASMVSRDRILDNEEIDNYFQAGIDFLVEKGVYCVETHRVIQLTEQEIKDGIRLIPEDVTMGEGKDVRVMKKRRWNGDKGYPVIGGGLHEPIREDLTPFVPMIFARIPRVDYMEGFTFREMDGYELYGPALEAYASKRQATWMREGFRKAGRPGMCVVYYPINTIASTLIAPIDPENGLRKSDGILIAMLPGLMCQYDYITAAIVYEQYGIAHKRCSGGGGGLFAAGPIAQTIAQVSSSIAGWILLRDNIGGGPAQIFDKKTKRIGFSHYAFSGGCLGLKGMLRIATECILAITSGVSAVSGGAIGRVESITPTAVELACEVCDATAKAGLKIEDAMQIISEIEIKHGVKEFFDMWRTFPTDPLSITGWDGKDYGFGTLRTNYDLAKMQPSQEHYNDYQEARKIIIDSGLDI